MYVTRDDLVDVIMAALEDELSEKTTKKERLAIADTIVEYLDGPILNVRDEDEEDDDSGDPSYEID